MCQVVISQVGVNSKATPLALRELQLVKSDGSSIPANRLQYKMSSSFAGPQGSWSTAKCFDGVTGAMGCHTGKGTDALGDLTPTLTVLYECPGGTTSLSKVLVHNYNEPCCIGWLRSYKMEFVAADGMLDGTFKFDSVGGTPASYEVDFVTSA